jgi:hypothetical protein
MTENISASGHKVIMALNICSVLGEVKNAGWIVWITLEKPLGNLLTQINFLRTVFTRKHRKHPDQVQLTFFNTLLRNSLLLQSNLISRKLAFLPSYHQLFST